MAQIGAQSKDVLHGSQRGTVIVADAVVVAMPFRDGRKDNHPDRTVPTRAFVPGNEDRPVVAVCLGSQNLGDLQRKPVVALYSCARAARYEVVHIVGYIGG